MNTSPILSSSQHEKEVFSSFFAFNQRVAVSICNVYNCFVIKRVRFGAAMNRLIESAIMSSEHEQKFVTRCLFPRFLFRDFVRGGRSIERDRDEREAIVLGNLTKCRVGFGDRGIVMCGYRNERRDSEGIERCGKGGRDVV